MARPSYSETVDVISLMPEQTQSQDIKIDKAPIVSDIKTILPFISLKMVSHSTDEQLWDHLVNTHHYLGYRKLLGHRLKYLGFMAERPIAAFSWSAPSIKTHFPG